MVAKKYPTKFVPITIARSDGVTVPEKDNEVRAPPDQQAEMDLKWRMAIGDFLKDQFAAKGDDREYILAAFPDGYEVRVCIARSKTTTAAPKRHTYGYGHPYGPTAKFRTAGELAPHILWLLSDSTDRADCSCDWCVKMVESSVKDSAKDSKVAASSNGGNLAPAAGANVTAAPKNQPDPDLFRLAELVWYKHGSWRLGIIILATNEASGDVAMGGVDGAGDEDSYRYVLAPLNHKSLNNSTVTKKSTEMRPFLTFSVPPTQNPALEGKSFDEINWEWLAEQEALNPVNLEQRWMLLGLDASKLAARFINFTFSTFNRRPGSPGQYYGGVFLGAEQIRIGDPLRVQPEIAGEHKSEVMRVKEIFVVPAPAPGQAEIKFKGDIYRLTTTEWTGQEAFESAQQLGASFADEVRYRNGLATMVATRAPSAPARPTKLAVFGWILTAREATRGEAEVYGRFYATSRLIRTIEPAAFEAAQAAATLVDATAYLNNRMNCAGGRYVGRVPSRKAAVGQAIAPGLLDFADGTILEDDDSGEDLPAVMA